MMASIPKVLSTFLKNKVQAPLKDELEKWRHEKK